MAGLFFLNKHYPLTLPPLLGEGASIWENSDPAALVQSHRAEQVLRQGSIGGNPAPGGQGFSPIAVVCSWVSVPLTGASLEWCRTVEDVEDLPFRLLRAFPD